MKHAANIFYKALNEASGCPVMCLSESEKEINAARNFGFVTKFFIDGKDEIYIPLKKITSFLKHEYKKEYKDEWFDKII